MKARVKKIAPKTKEELEQIITKVYAKIVPKLGHITD
jgi:hypothetical protein